MRSDIAYHRADSLITASSLCNVYERNTRVFFYIGFALVVVNRIIGQAAANLGLGILEGLPLIPAALCLLAVRCFATMLDADLKRVALAFTLLVLSFVSYIKSGQSYLPTACLLLCGIGGIDVRRVIKVTSACILLLIVGLGLIQFMEWAVSGNLVGSVMRQNGKLRLSFYFAHPNTLSAITCMAYIGMTFFRDKLNVVDLLFGFVVGVLIIMVTDSRTSSVILFVYVLLRMLFQSRCELLGKGALFVYSSLPILFEALAFAVPLHLLPDATISLLNLLFNGRPGYWILQFEQLGGFSLFGQVTLYGNQLINGWLYPHVTIDCFYAATLLQIGAWSFLAFFLLYFHAGKLAVKEGDNCKFAALAACAMFGFTEVHMIDFAICFPMLLLGENLFPPAMLSNVQKDNMAGFSECSPDKGATCG